MPPSAAAAASAARIFCIAVAIATFGFVADASVAVCRQTFNSGSSRCPSRCLLPAAVRHRCQLLWQQNLCLLTRRTRVCDFCARRVVSGGGVGCLETFAFVNGSLNSADACLPECLMLERLQRRCQSLWSSSRCLLKPDAADCSVCEDSDEDSASPLSSGSGAVLTSVMTAAVGVSFLTLLCVTSAGCLLCRVRAQLQQQQQTTERTTWRQRQLSDFSSEKVSEKVRNFLEVDEEVVVDVT